jgi:hypothetical protein
LKKKLFLCLLGGLGNQLFQYAYARNLQIKYNFDLILDHKTGFMLDLRDKRTFELRDYFIKIQKKFVPFFLLFKIYKKIFKSKKLITFFLKKTIIDETNCKSFQKKILAQIKGKKIYLHGFFQSEKYFIDNKKLILKELMPKQSKNKLFKNFVSKIKTDKSVAVGIRLFGEVNSKDIKKIGGRLSVDYYNKKLNYFKKNIFNPHFYIFSNEESKNFLKFLDKLNINKKDYTLVTPNKGFENPYDTLWILSHFKNQIISNSTFFWWGAYFAKQRFKGVSLKIKYPKNFSNKDTVYGKFF